MSEADVFATIGDVAGEPVAQCGPATQKDFTYVDIGSVDRDAKVITERKKLTASEAPSRARQVLKTGDVLVSMTRPNLNAVAHVPATLDGAIGSTGFHVLRSQWMAPGFLYYLVQTTEFVDAMSSVVQGALYPAVRPADIAKFRFRLPPRAEQTRIVEKLEELLGSLDTAVAELKAAQRKLAHYRQSLLKAAVEGTLTAQWRAARTSSSSFPRRRESSFSDVPAEQELDSRLRGNDGKSETGPQLLQRILQERRARWEDKQRAKFAQAGKTPPKGWQAKYPEPVAPATTDLPALPEGWVWTSLDQLVADSSYGTSAKCGYENGGTPVLRIPNVSGGNIDLRDMKFSSEALPLATDDFLKIGDVLVIRTNGSIGLVGRAAAITAPLPSGHYFASYLLRLRCAETAHLHLWVSTFLGSPIGRKWIEERAASSAGQHNISLSTLLTMPVPLPPTEEQTQITTTLETQLFAAKEQESALTHSLHQAAAQRRNLLKAAFAGQLVPQDPTDDPASELLARIRTAKADNAGNARRKPRTSQRQ